MILRPDMHRVTERAEDFPVEQQQAAMRGFAAEIAPECPPLEWSALTAGHRLLLHEGRACGGVVYHAKDGSRRPGHVVVELCTDPDRAAHTALFVLHELAHVEQARREGGAFLPGDAHERPAWREACEALSLRCFAVAAVSPMLLGKSWPAQIASLADWREPLQHLARTLQCVAFNLRGAPYDLRHINAARATLEELFDGNHERRERAFRHLLRD